MINTCCANLIRFLKLGDPMKMLIELYDNILH